VQVHLVNAGHALLVPFTQKVVDVPPGRSRYLSKSYDVVSAGAETAGAYFRRLID
jgi:hypothetical protein